MPKKSRLSGGTGVVLGLNVEVCEADVLRRSGTATAQPVTPHTEEFHESRLCGSDRAGNAPITPRFLLGETHGHTIDADEVDDAAEFQECDEGSGDGAFQECEMVQGGIFDMDLNFKNQSEPGFAYHDNLNYEPLIKRRRLFTKTDPSYTFYTKAALINLTKLKIILVKNKLTKRDYMSSLRALKLTAIQLVVAQPEIIGESELMDSQPWHIHASHEMKKIGDTDILYCNLCGRWLADGKERKFVAPCQGLRKSNTSQLRLLQCGVRPGPGARIPASMRKGRVGRPPTYK